MFFSLQPDLSFLYFEDFTLLPRQFAPCSLPSPHPLPYAFLLQAFAHVLPSSGGKKTYPISLLFFKSCSFFKAHSNPQRLFPRHYHQQQSPLLEDLTSLTGLTTHTSPVFNFLRISMFATFYLKVKDREF